MPSLLLEESGTCGAPLRQSKALKSLPLLDRHEVKTSNFVGEGTYSYVFEVHKFALDAPCVENCPLRQHLQQTAYNPKSGKTNYVIKQLKPDLLKKPQEFQEAARDLMTEAYILSQLDHPNILKVRGMARGIARTQALGICKDPQTSFFLITDKLQETLSDRINNWRLQKARQGLNREGTPRRLLREKIHMALQIGHALEYIHARRLVFRDLKPQNIGIDANSQIRLLDFGFCRQLPEPISLFQTQCGGGCMPRGAGDFHVDAPEQDDALYHMSGKGTLMYMAPEIFQHAIYNQKADVYSWSMVFYELLTLEHPFPNTAIEEHRLRVGAIGERPDLERFQESIPYQIKYLLQRCWMAKIAHRFTMSCACRYLSTFCREFHHDGDDDDDDDLLSSIVKGPCDGCQPPLTACTAMIPGLAGCNLYETFWDVAVGAQYMYVELRQGLLRGLETQPAATLVDSNEEALGGKGEQKTAHKTCIRGIEESIEADGESYQCLDDPQVIKGNTPLTNTSTTTTTSGAKRGPVNNGMGSTFGTLWRKEADSPTSVAKLSSVCLFDPPQYERAECWREQQDFRDASGT